MQFPIVFGECDMWRYLANTNKKIILYGMGNGADKIAAKLKCYGAEIAGVAASDEFAQRKNKKNPPHNTYLGFTIHKISEVEQVFGKDIIILLCFGTDKPDVIKRICDLSERYETYAPDAAVAGDDELDEDVRVRELFADELSKYVYDGIAEYKRTWKIPPLRRCVSDENEMYGLIDTDNVRTIIDLGAFVGDTAKEFAKRCVNYEKIIAVEPDARNFNRLVKANINGVIPVNAAVWNEVCAVPFLGGGGRQGKVSSAGSTVQALTIDKICEDYGLIPDLIKLDVEGAEENALLGGKNTIEKYKPKLMVTAYHRMNDLFSLPKLILSLNGGYKIYLRRKEYIPAWETILTAINE
jgi:FkbM family methyltransferase